MRIIYYETLEFPSYNTIFDKTIYKFRLKFYLRNLQLMILNLLTNGSNSIN